VSVLIDTSVWVAHFRSRNDALAELVEADWALTHPMVVVELACGTPPAPRAQTLDDIGFLRSCNQATLREVRDFIERERLYGSGCGLVDMSLLASTLITPGARIWTLDKSLSDTAERFDVTYQLPH